LPYENGVSVGAIERAMLLRDGGVGLAWRVGVPPTESIPDGELDVARAVDLLVRCLPAGWTMQVYRRNIPGCERAIRTYEQRAAPVGALAIELMRERIGALREAARPGFFPGHPLNFWPTTEELTIAVRSPPLRAYGLLANDARLKARDDQIRDVHRSIEQALHSGGLSKVALAPGEIVGFAATLLNPLLLDEGRRYAPDVTLDDAAEALAAVVDLRPEEGIDWTRGCESHWKGARRVLRIVSMMWQPDAVQAGLVDKVLQSQRGVCAISTMHMLQQQLATTSIKARRFLNSRMRLPWNAEAIDEIDASLTEALRRTFGGERIVGFRMHVLVESDTAKEADETAAYIANALDATCSIPAIVENDIGGSLVAGGILPFCFDRDAERAYARQRRLLSFDAARLTFAAGTWSGVQRNVNVLHLNRKGRPLMLSTYEAEKNANFMVAGSSGGGKTFWVHDMVIQESRLPGARFYLTSVKPDYRKLALLKGRYIEIHPDSPHAINPFHGPPTQGNAELWGAVLETMMRDETGLRLSTDERMLLVDAALMAARESQERYAGARETRLAHIVTKLVGFEGDLGKQMARRLRDYHGEGIYAGLFDRESTISPEDSFVFFNLRDVAAMRCYEAVLMAIHTYIDGIMTDPQLQRVQKTFITDEGWGTQRNEMAARFVERAARIYRSLGGRLGAVSQSFDDYMTPYGRAVLQSTATKFVLAQDATALASLRDYLTVNEAEFDLIRSLRVEKGHYGEYFVKMEGKGATVGRIVATPFTYALATTDPEDEGVIEEWAIAAGGDWRAAIQRFATEYPRGVAAARAER
jgi:hypothetical protein